MIVGVTGHRPSMLGGYGREARERLVRFARTELPHFEPTRIITGMALGWDQAVAEAAIELGMPFTAALAFDGQDSVWRPKDRERFQWLCDRAADVVVVTPGTFASWKLQRRNEYIMDNCDVGVALWCGLAGGTMNTVRYGQSIKRTVVNLWDRWRRQSTVSVRV